MFLVMSLMTAKIGRDGTEGGAITPHCGAELKLGSGDKASRGWGVDGRMGRRKMGSGANFRGGAVVDRKSVV